MEGIIKHPAWKGIHIQPPNQCVTFTSYRNHTVVIDRFLSWKHFSEKWDTLQILAELQKRSVNYYVWYANTVTRIMIKTIHGKD